MADRLNHIHHPALKQLYAYWLGKLGGRLAPARADIDPVEMGQCLPHVFLLDVIGDPPRFRFRLAGTEVVTRYGQELTGRFLDEIDLDHVAGAIIDEYKEAIGTAQPVYGQWDYRKHDGRYLKYERIILPLSSDGQKIDMLLCGAHVDERRPEKPR